MFGSLFFGIIVMVIEKFKFGFMVIFFLSVVFVVNFGFIVSVEL